MITYFIMFLSLVACSKEAQTDAPIASVLHEVGKLELVEYRTEEIFIISPKDQSLKPIMTLEEMSNYISDLLTIGDRVGVYSFENYSVAYIDLTLLNPQEIHFDTSKKSIAITLPAIQIEPIGRSGNIRKLHERVSGLQKSITSEERKEMQDQASALAIKALAPGTSKYKELVMLAEKKARTYFTGMLHARGYKEVIIAFKS